MLALAIRSQIDFDLPAYTPLGFDKYFWIFFIILGILFYEKIYIYRYDFWIETKRIMLSVVISFTLVFTLLALAKMNVEYSRILLGVFFLLLFLFMPLYKRMIKLFLFQFEHFKVSVFVYNDGDKMLQDEIEENWYLGLKRSSSEYQMVLINSDGLSVEKLSEAVNYYTHKTKELYVVPYLKQINFTNSNIVEYSNLNLSMIQVQNNLLNRYNIFIKYLFEKLLVILLIPFVLLLHIVVSLLIKLDSTGSVLYKQKRFGKGGRSFSCYKYRSMYEESDELLQTYLRQHPEEIENYQQFHKYENDPRITKIGAILRKLSIDEIPQFYNVLRGDMNLIGPRPYMVSEKDKIGKQNLEDILRVKPGLTGLWQVQGRNELSFIQRVELDKWYIKNWTLWMDFVVFAKTIKIVLFGKGAR
jgi:undecaprenyl-phosphate galactose phosphotransferase